MSNNKKIIFYIGGVVSWTMLGFKRGMNDYDYTLKCSKEHNSKKTYLYTTRIIYGFAGTFFYINPIFFIPLMYKEIYRLEVNLRGLENEKNSVFYNSLL